ncbi:MAG: hypothetical protein ACRDTJ_04590, partial [Pseudonocardiaceae bacterium]
PRAASQPASRRSSQDWPPDPTWCPARPKSSKLNRGRRPRQCGADFDFHGPEAAEDAGQSWTATTWTLNSLREWGLDPIRAARQSDGTWLQARRHPGRVWFEVDAPAGEGSDGALRRTGSTPR